MGGNKPMKLVSYRGHNDLLTIDRMTNDLK